MKEEIQAKNEARLSEILMNRGFQELEVKAYDGVISYGTRKTKRKIY
jgi:hypothetical protein